MLKPWKDLLAASHLWRTEVWLGHCNLKVCHMGEPQDRQAIVSSQ